MSTCKSDLRHVISKSVENFSFQYLLLHWGCVPYCVPSVIRVSCDRSLLLSRGRIPQVCRNSGTKSLHLTVQFTNPSERSRTRLSFLDSVGIQKETMCIALSSDLERNIVLKNKGCQSLCDNTLIC